METNREIRCKSPFENWSRVSGSKLDVSEPDLNSALINRCSVVHEISNSIRHGTKQAPLTGVTDKFFR